MSRIGDAFLRAQSSGSKAYLPYVCLGDPDEGFSIELLKALQGAGADGIEVGIPFSDTLADGKSIQNASDRALLNGMTPKRAIGVVKKAREAGVTIPLIAMTYYNVVFHHGVERFAADLEAGGGDGIILPDVPLEESEEVAAACKRHSLDFIYLVAPTTTNARLKRIIAQATGFLYVVAVAGTTGARKEISQDAVSLLARVKELSRIPVAIGFGISTPGHAYAYSKAGADGVVEGSQIVNIYNPYFEKGISNEAKAAAIAAVALHAREMKASLW